MAYAYNIYREREMYATESHRDMAGAHVRTYVLAINLCTYIHIIYVSYVFCLHIAV
jgi:hypothetical protein